ncbi:hypothetical protein L1987_71358 [Smallanthus sonchifolius]|uniref:Uncharacterized protein n=1 Tax=Smallanthus sonchifolius TaxID=185202 RepID=A0ACB9ASU1_9ASTR|nr:hypothetical protein L1987_71358 [Smallanthus sonchifolius]
MGEDRELAIENFNAADFSWWKMQIKALVGQKDLDVVLEEKPDKIEKAEETLWNAKDKKARGAIVLALSRSVAFNIMSETTARGMMLALSNIYEKLYALNKVFLMRELFTMRMREGSSAVILVSSLPDSWSGTVTAATSSVGPDCLTFEKMCDMCRILGHGFWCIISCYHSNGGMRNVKVGDFGKFKLGNVDILEVTGMGDLDLITTLGATWILNDVRIIPKLETDHPVKTNIKVGLANSTAKRVKFVERDYGTSRNSVERIRRSERVWDFGGSESTRGVPTQSKNQCWVRKTKVPNEISPVMILLVGNIPLRIPVSDDSCLWGSVGIEDVKTGSFESRLKPSRVSTGPSGY